MSFDDVLRQRLSVRREKCLFRERALVSSGASVEQQVDSQSLINFCSNDYLGLASDVRAAKVIGQTSVEAGFGSGASHLVSGHSYHHHQLELALAEATGRERAVLFSTGYMANLGVITALVGKSQHILADKLNHASLVDACQLVSAQNAKKQFFRYRHGDLSHLEVLLKKAPRHSLVVTDGVFSMDGDVAPLRELAELTACHEAVLMVDDAHGFGCLGEAGAGSVVAAGLDQADIPIYMGTLGKAVGGFGAFVAGSRALIETLIQFARPYIYTTALPPAVAAGNLANVNTLRHEPEHQRRLVRNITYFKELFDALGCGSLSATLLPSDTPIQPVILGGEARTLAIAQYLKDRGFWVGAIRPPTVPQGTARLRITLSAAHTESQINGLCKALSAALGKVRDV